LAAILFTPAADALAATKTFEKRQRRTAMALKVELKPHERIIVGSCVITNTDQRARLLIDGDNVPILREKDILTPETANTPAKLVYLAVQLMYISPDPQGNHGTYFNLVREIVTAVPSAWPIIEDINNNILSGDLYRALKEARKLIAYEKKLRDLHEASQEMRNVGTAA
jgi:flagellar biosynthesis repressor protein FlbT